MEILSRYGCSDSLQKNIVGYNITSWSSTYLHRRVVHRDNNTYYHPGPVYLKMK